MDHIVLTCNSINIQLFASQFMNHCRMFLLHFRNPHISNPPQILPYCDVTDWFKYHLSIYYSLRLEFIGYKFSKLFFHT